MTMRKITLRDGTVKKVYDLKRSPLKRSEKPIKKVSEKAKVKKIANSESQSAKIERLDKLVSYFVRQRDADENGYVRCISCGAVHEWKYIQCGHYISRRFKSIRFDELNCNGQCYHCNINLKGNVLEYQKGLIKKIGEKEVEILDLKKNNEFDKSTIDILTFSFIQKIKANNYEMP